MSLGHPRRSRLEKKSVGHDMDGGASRPEKEGDMAKTCLPPSNFQAERFVRSLVRGKACDIGMRLTLNFFYANTYRDVKNYSCMFEISRLNAARQLGHPMHSQPANFGKFKLNSLNLAGIILHDSVLVSAPN